MLKGSTNPKSLLRNFGYKKYIQVSGEATLQIDQKKMQQEERWDGVSGVITNAKDLSPASILYQYSNLWQIESCFRVQKHDLKIRPIYHWTPKRIRTHIAICFIAFSCHQYLAYRLRLQEYTLSIEKIQNSLIHVQMSILKNIDTGYRYGIPSSINDDAKMIYKILRLKRDNTPFLVS